MTIWGDLAIPSVGLFFMENGPHLNDDLSEPL